MNIKTVPIHDEHIAWSANVVQHLWPTWVYIPVINGRMDRNVFAEKDHGKKKKTYDTILVIDLTTSSFNGLLIIGFFFFEDSMKWRKRFDKKKNEQIAKLWGMRVQKGGSKVGPNAPVQLAAVCS